MAIKSIEERLHAKADKELKEELDAALKPLERFIGTNNPTMFPGTENAKTLRFYLGAIGSRLIEVMQENRRDLAVKNFLSRVEDMQDQLDELRNDINR